MSGRSRTTLVTFLAAMGAAVALAAIPIAIGRGASDETQVVAGIAATIALLVAGWLFGPAEGRMRSVLWFLAVFAWTGVAKVTFTEVIDGPDGKWLVVTVAAVALALALPLWWVERRSLQFLAMFATAHLTVAAAVSGTQQVSVLGIGVVPEVPDLTWSALATVVLGAASLWAGATARVEPRRTAAVIGSLALIAGAGLVDIDVLDPGPSTLALVAALVASAAVLVIGERIADRAVAGIAIAGVLLVAAGMVGDVAESRGAGAAALVIGVAAVAAGVVLARRSTPQD